LVIVHARKLSDYVKENIELSVFMKEDANEVDIIRFQKSLDASGFVKSTEYITKDAAAEKLKQDLGEDFINFLGYNPLQPSIDIRLKAIYANSQNLIWIERDIKKSPVVAEVYYQKSLVNLVNENLRSIALTILVFSGLLAVIAIALINNTIRLALYSKRFLIHSMQLVGATKSFIRKPFIVKGIMHGL
jgi:cell division transport system permease protein